MKYLSLPLLASAVLLGGCNFTNYYTPEANATGEQIFEGICSQCHHTQASAGGSKVYYKLSRDKSNAAAIKKQISEGGWMMPAFPNIQGQALDTITEFVLAHSKVVD